MWEAISNILTSSNAISTLTFLAVCLIGAFVLIKTGMLQIHTKAVQIGAADMERNIIRLQLDFVRRHLVSVENNLKKPAGYDEYLGKLIIEKVYDEYVNWITFNHISAAPDYVEVKQDSIVDIIGAYTVRPEFKSKEFEEFIRKDTRETIEGLIKIREVYKQ